MELRDVVRQSIEAMLIMDQYSGLPVHQFSDLSNGAERVILVSAVRNRLPGAMTDRLAWEIADFVPLALARALLTEMGARLHPHYIRIDSEGRLRTYRLLEDEPVFREAAALAMEVAARPDDGLLRLAKYSTEFRLINEALHAGSRTRDLEPSPPVLNGPDELCDPLEAQPTFEEEHWWMGFWLPKPKKPWWKLL